MAKFIWTKEYSVDLAVIDDQHKHFFEIANHIVEAIDHHTASTETLLFLLGDLADYAFYHFKTEEDYFDKFKYIDAAAHIAEHNFFREKIQKDFDKTRTPNAKLENLSREIVEFSSDWLKYHILTVDKKYTVFFKEHGLQ